MTPVWQPCTFGSLRFGVLKASQSIGGDAIERHHESYYAFVKRGSKQIKMLADQ